MIDLDAVVNDIDSLARSEMVDKWASRVEHLRDEVRNRLRFMELTTLQSLRAAEQRNEAETGGSGTSLDAKENRDNGTGSDQ